MYQISEFGTQIRSLVPPPRCSHRPGAWPSLARQGPWSPLAALGAHPVGYQSARGRQDPHPTAGRFPGPWAPLSYPTEWPTSGPPGPPPVGPGIQVPPGPPVWGSWEGVYRPPGTPHLGGPGRGYFGGPRTPLGDPLGGGPRPPWAGAPPGGRPGARGPGGVHFRGYLITLPVGTDVGIRNRKGWFSGGQKSPPGRPGAQNRPPGAPPGPPREAPLGGGPGGPKKGVFLTPPGPPK